MAISRGKEVQSHRLHIPLFLVAIQSSRVHSETAGDCGYVCVSERPFMQFNTQSEPLESKDFFLALKYYVFHYS